MAVKQLLWYAVIVPGCTVRRGTWT